MFLNNLLEENNLTNSDQEERQQMTANNDTNFEQATNNNSILSTLTDVNVILTTVYLIIFLIGVIGNICNCLVIADSRNKYMRTATNYYLFSLSVSDLLLLIFGLPHDIVNLWHPSPYMFNQFVCISRGWISEASTYASVLVIVAFTFERYLAICHPLKSHTLSRISRTVKIIIIIWLIASTCALLVVMQYGIITIVEKKANGQDIANPQCTTVNRNETIFELSSLIFFIIPMTVITILYVNLGYHLRKKTSLIRKQNKIRKQKQLLQISRCKLEREREQEEQRRQEVSQQQHSEHLHRHSSSNYYYSEAKRELEAAGSLINHDSGQSVKRSKSSQISNWLSNLSKKIGKINKGEAAANDGDDLNLSQVSYKLEESCVPISSEFVCMESVDFSENRQNNSTNDYDNNKSMGDKSELESSSIDRCQNTSKVAVRVCHENDFDRSIPNPNPNPSLIPTLTPIDPICAQINAVGERAFSNSDKSLQSNNLISPLADKLTSSLSNNCIPFGKQKESNKFTSFGGGTSFSASAIQPSNLSAANQTSSVDRISLASKKEENDEIKVLMETATTTGFNDTGGKNEDSDEIEKCAAAHSIKRSSSNENNHTGESEPSLPEQQHNLILMKTNKLRSNSNEQVASEQIRGGDEDKRKSVGQGTRIKHSASSVKGKLFTPHLTSNHRFLGKDLRVQNGSTMAAETATTTRKQLNESQVTRGNLSLKNQEPIALNSTANAGNLQSVIKMLGKF